MQVSIKPHAANPGGLSAVIPVLAAVPRPADLGEARHPKTEKMRSDPKDQASAGWPSETATAAGGCIPVEASTFLSASTREAAVDKTGDGPRGLAPDPAAGRTDKQAFLRSAPIPSRNGT